MSALPLVTPMNLSQYQRFSTFQQVSHDRHHSGRFSDTSPPNGESPLPIAAEDSLLHPPADIHSSPAFPHLTRSAQYVSLPPADPEKPVSAPAESVSFPIPSYGYVTPPQHFAVLEGTPLRPVAAAWPGIRPEHHRSHSWAGAMESWAAAPPPAAPATMSSPPPHAFSSPPYGTPLHRPIDMAGGVDGYDALAYTTYAYPIQPEWEVPRAMPAKRSINGSPDKVGRRHICPVCDKRFNRPSSLQTHMAVHTGAKPYICPRPDCGRRFSVSSNLRRHEKTHAPRGACSSPESHAVSGAQFHPYGQPLPVTPFMSSTNMPLEWQPAPLSSGLGHYSISRTSTRHEQPTTPETPPVYAFGVDEDMDSASVKRPSHAHI